MKALVWLLALPVATALSWAQPERVGDIGQQKAQKEAIVKYLQKQIRDHGKMSTTELLLAMTQDYAIRRRAVEEMKDLEGSKKADLLKALDIGFTQIQNELNDDVGRELFLAREKRHLQNIQSSGWYIFAFTFWIIVDASESHGGSQWKYALLLITVPLELAVLPVTALLTFATGWG